jgi:hypothetical protein
MNVRNNILAWDRHPEFLALADIGNESIGLGNSQKHFWIMFLVSIEPTKSGASAILPLSTLVQV